MASTKLPARKDPEPKSIDETLEWNSVRDKDPNRYYIWVFNGTPMARARYFSLGFEVEVYRDGGPMPVAMVGRKKGKSYQDGEEIVIGDHTLMSCDLADHQALEERKRAHANAFDARLRGFTPGGEMDPRKDIGKDGALFGVQPDEGHGR